MENETGMTTPPGFRPLYQQVHDLLRSRIANGIWRPSEALPSEQALAAELGVSQGTVRKALDALAADQLVERRQGKGTYVAQHTQESALFRFFRLARPRNGARVTPESRLLSVERRAALKADRERLQIAGRQDVMEARRVRMIDNRPLILETIIASLALFPDLDKQKTLPNTLYELYQTAYGISVFAAKEELRAEAATAEDAAHLDIAEGAPLMQIDRIALALDGTPAEWRISRCVTRDLVYAVTLR